MTEHPKRADLIRAVRSGDRSLDEHLASCTSCRKLADLFNTFPVSGHIHLTNAPEFLIERAVAIASEERVRTSPLKKWFYDSWMMPAPEGVRGTSTRRERRLVFHESGTTLDLRAEYRAGQWSFIATVAASPGSQVELFVGRKRITVDDAGFYQWTSKRPPAQLELRALGRIITLPGLTWTEEAQTR